MNRKSMDLCIVNGPGRTTEVRENRAPATNLRSVPGPRFIRHAGPNSTSQYTPRRAPRLSPLASPRHGLTLLELLVTVSILLMLLTVALPILTPTDDARQIREAARSISVYLSAARNRAMETGRPAGVSLERIPTLTRGSLVLRRVEVPPVYSGDDFNTMVKIQGNSANSTLLTIKITSGTFNNKNINQYDRIRVNYRNPDYRIDDVNTAGDTITAYNDSGAALPWPTAYESDPMPFEIFRRPIPARAPPLNLPPTAAIDLQYSGREYTGLTGTLANTAFWTSNQTNNTLPTILLFGPNGSCTRVFNINSTSGALQSYNWADRIFLLVGRRDQLATGVQSQYNWQDAASLWVTIDQQSGQIAVKENAIGTTYLESRILARGTDTKGGR